MDGWTDEHTHARTPTHACRGISVTPNSFSTQKAWFALWWKAVLVSHQGCNGDAPLSHSASSSILLELKKNNNNHKSSILMLWYLTSNHFWSWKRVTCISNSCSSETFKGDKIWICEGLCHKTYILLPIWLNQCNNLLLLDFNFSYF